MKRTDGKKRVAVAFHALGLLSDSRRGKSLIKESQAFVLYQNLNKTLVDYIS